MDRVTPISGSELAYAPEIERQRRQVAQELGVSASEVRPAISLQALADLIRLNTVVVSVTVGYKRFLKKASMEDLGFDTSDPAQRHYFAEYVLPGDLGLLPKAERKRNAAIEQSIREVLERNSRPIFGVRVMTTAQYARFEEEIKKPIERFWERRDELVAKYPELQKRVFQDYYDQGKKLWSDLVKRGIDIGKSQEEFAQGYAEGILRSMPTAQELADSFRIEIRRDFVPIPALEEATVESNRIEQAFARGDIDEAQREMMLSIVQERMAGLDRQLDAVIEEYLASIYETMETMCYKAVESIRNNGVLVGPIAGMLRNQLRVIEELKFWQNDDVEELIAKLREVIPVEGTRTTDVDRVLKGLDAVRTASRSRLALIGGGLRLRLIDDRRERELASGAVKASARRARIAVEELGAGELVSQPSRADEERDELVAGRVNDTSRLVDFEPRVS